LPIGSADQRAQMITFSTSAYNTTKNFFLQRTLELLLYFG
jgi:hypothetical protein